MFPGQPVTLSGPPGDSPAFIEISVNCCERTGFNPLTGETISPQLSENVRLQLYGVCRSLAGWREFVWSGQSCTAIAEHSMGIYPALAAAGSISESDAIDLTYRIGLLMTAGFQSKSYTLGCAIGLPCEKVCAIAANNGIYLANLNTSRHFLVAGLQDGVAAARLEAEAAGVFSFTMFPCDAPLHTPLMGEIGDGLREIISEYSFRDPVLPVISHLDQSVLSASDIPLFLKEELCLPVYWEKTYRALRDRGINRFVEVGQGQALTKFNRWIDSES